MARLVLMFLLICILSGSAARAEVQLESLTLVEQSAKSEEQSTAIEIEDLLDANDTDTYNDVYNALPTLTFANLIFTISHFITRSVIEQITSNLELLGAPVALLVFTLFLMGLLRL
ncbi:MAG: hypothetical protein AB7W16_04490 [Candidatus Obscuribacterales bacterium]